MRHDLHNLGFLRVAAGCFIAVVASFFLLCSPRYAYADLQADLIEVQSKIVELNQTYNDLCDEVDRLEANIEQTQNDIDTLEHVTIPAQKEKATDAMKTLYRLGQDQMGVVDYILSSSSFYDALSSAKYIDSIQAYNESVLEELNRMCDELAEYKVDLERQLTEVESTIEAQQEAIAAANATREKLQDTIAVQLASEEAAAAAALAAAELAVNTGDGTFTATSGNVCIVNLPSTAGLSDIDWTLTKEEFVAEWTERIDAYLARSPLRGYGSVFAEAAWEYCVDPRLSPAISTIESSTGVNCFLPHNAWGWGQVSWNSWEEAIWAHIKGLSEGYCGVLTVWGAYKYNATHPDQWYVNVLYCMQQI